MDDRDLSIQKLKNLFQEIVSWRDPGSRSRHEPRYDVFEIVAQSPSSEIEQFLVQTVQTHSDRSVRMTAIEALGRMQAKTATEYLMTILQNKDEEKEVRSEAAKALGQIGTESAMPLLIETLRTKNNGRIVLWHCADALGYFHDITAVDALVDALVEDYSRIKDSSDIRDAARDALVAIGDEYTVKRLIEKLAIKTLNSTDYNDEGIRLDIIIALGQIQNPLAINPLLEIAQDTNNSYLQEPAIDMLVNFDDSRIVPALRTILRSTDEDVRKSA